MNYICAKALLHAVGEISPFCFVYFEKLLPEVASAVDSDLTAVCHSWVVGSLEVEQHRHRASRSMDLSELRLRYTLLHKRIFNKVFFYI